jgi:hypothetical protein
MDRKSRFEIRRAADERLDDYLRRLDEGDVEEGGTGGGNLRRALNILGVETMMAAAPGAKGCTMRTTACRHNRHPAPNYANIAQKKLRRIVAAQPELFPLNCGFTENCPLET